MQIQRISSRSVALAIGLAALLSLIGQQVAFNQMLPPPDKVVFTINNLNGPTIVQVGQEAKFCAHVKNTGNNEGSQLIAFRVNDANVATLQKALKNQEEAEICFKHTFTAPGTYQVSIVTENDSKSVTVQVTAASGQQPPQQQPSGPMVEIALIHSLKNLAIYPSTITVKKGIRVKIYNAANDGEHDPIIIKDASGALMPGTKPFAVRPGEITVIEFVPEKAGEYTISHELHGHKIAGKLIVSE